MTANSITRNEAGRRFIDYVVAAVYDGTVQSIQTILKDGPAGRSPSPELSELHHWFASLDPDSRRQIEVLIAKVVDFATFNFLVLLDGLSAGPPLRDVPSDFALYLQTYSDRESRIADSPTASVRTNRGPPDLHDLFLSALNERNMTGPMD